MKTFKLGLFAVVAATMVFGLFGQYAKAASPNLIATMEGTSLRLTVQYANAYSAVSLYSRQGTSLWTVSSNIGNTDGTGYFNGLVNPGINPNGVAVEAYVMVNGQQSNVVNVSTSGSGCTTSECLNNLDATMTTVTLDRGQSNVVYFYPKTGQGVYVASNPNPSLVTTSINGNTMIIYANGGSNYTSQTILRVCSSYGNECVNITVIINGLGGGTSQISLNPTSLTLTRGQTGTAQITANNASSFYISNNSNSTVANAWITGSTLYVNGLTVGGTTLGVCSISYAMTNVYPSPAPSCTQMFVTVSDYNTGTQVTLSPSSLVLNTNQTGYVTVSSNNSSDVFAVVSNTNYNAASFTMSGHTLTVYAYNPGTTTMTVCRTSYDDGHCAKLVVTVNGTIPPPPSLYRNGVLISENGTIYQVYRNHKSGFASWDAFVGLGYRLENVLNVNSGLTTSGYIVQSRYMAHPFGTWIKMGTTVDFVSDQGLIPITTYDIFLNNGGQDRLVVPANSYDYSSPMLPFMQYGDYRLN